MKETQNIEWKESWRDEFLKWICGFANAEGGVLHIGRNNKGVVVGLSNAARLLEEIPNKARDILGVVVDVKLHDEAGLEWLEIAVERTIEKLVRNLKADEIIGRVGPAKGGYWKVLE